MASYREFGPPAALSTAVECFWTLEAAPGDAPHRVCPDGCTDVLVTQSRSGMSIEAVGAMTAFRDFRIPAGQRLTGVRFRPGGWPSVWELPVADAIAPFEDLSRVRIASKLAGASTEEECVRILSRAIPVPESASAAQEALAALESAHGCIAIDDLVAQAGLSARQFRRVCLSLTGLTPKFLAQVLRFRHAQSCLSAAGAAAHALACGYYDQPHFINQFRRFSGRTPMADFSNRSLMTAR